MLIMLLSLLLYAWWFCLSSIETNWNCLRNLQVKKIFAITLLMFFFIRVFSSVFFLSNGTNAVPVTLLMTLLFVIATRTAFVIAGITIRSLFIC